MKEELMVGALGVWALRELWSLVSNERKELRQGLARLQIEIATLSAQAKYLGENLSIVHKLREDVNELFRRSRPKS